MRIRQIAVVILLFSLIAPVVISSASATEWNPPLILGEDYPNLYTANDMIWVIDFKLVYKEPYFAIDCQTITSLTYEYNLEGSIDFLPITLEPAKVSLSDGMVKIWWNIDDLNAWKDSELGAGAVIQHARVIGTFENGDTFLATGPGFTYAFRPR